MPERAQPLLEPALEPGAVGRRDQAREQAEREDLLGAARVAVDRERDALLEQRVLGQRLGARELVLPSPCSSCITRENGGRGDPVSKTSS